MSPGFDRHCFKRVVDAALKKDKPLSLELLQNITDSGTSLQDIIGMLCIYINSAAKAEAGSVQAWCDINMTVQELTEKAQFLNTRCNDAINAMLKARQQEADLVKRMADKELETADLKIKVRELQSRLSVMELLGSP